MSQRPLNRQPLHSQLAERLRREFLATGTPGSRMPSEAALAQRFNVSLTTLREALSALAHQGLLERRHGSGTYIAAPPADRHLAVVTEMDLSNPRAPYFQLSTIHHLEALCTEAGHATRLYLGRTAPGSPSPAATSLRALLEALERRQITGVLAISTLSTPDLIRSIDRAGIPGVGTDPGWRHWVATDGVARVRTAVRNLIDRGCRRLAMQAWEGCAAGPGDAASPSAILRSELAAAGLPFEPAWVITRLHPHQPGSGRTGFHRLWQARPSRPDGLVLCDDNYFPEVALEIVRRGIDVPRNLQVATFSNRGSGMAIPFPATVVELDPAVYAGAMVGRLLDLLAGNPVPAGPLLVPHASRYEEPVPMDDDAALTGPPHQGPA